MEAVSRTPILMIVARTPTLTMMDGESLAAEDEQSREREGSEGKVDELDVLDVSYTLRANFCRIFFAAVGSCRCCESLSVAYSPLSPYG